MTTKLFEISLILFAFPPFCVLLLLFSSQVSFYLYIIISQITNSPQEAFQSVQLFNILKVSMQIKKISLQSI